MVQVDAQIIDVASSGPFKQVALAAPAIAPGPAAGRFVLADLGGYTSRGHKLSFFKGPKTRSNERF